MSLPLGTCGRRFRRAFPSNRRFFNEIVAYQELFCVVTLLSELERATTTMTKETRTYKKQQVSNQIRLPRVTVCFDRCKKFHVLKERRCIHPKCFSCSPANYTWSERNFRAISLLKFVSKRLVLKPVSSSQGEINTKRSVLTNGQGISRHIYKAYLTGTTKLTNQIYYETGVRQT